MDIVDKFFKKEKDEDNKLIDEFYFKKNGETYKVELIKEYFFLNNYFIYFKKSDYDGFYWNKDSEGFTFLSSAKRYFNKLKGKYCKKL